MVTSSAKNSGSNPQPSPDTKPSSYSVSEMLTPSEVESLRRDKKEADDFAKKAFGHLRSRKAG